MHIYVAEGYLRTSECVGVVFKRESSEVLRYPLAARSPFPFSRGLSAAPGPQRLPGERTKRQDIISYHSNYIILFYTILSYILYTYYIYIYVYIL